MNTEHSSNNFLSIIFGACAGIVSFVMDYNHEFLLFGIGLLKSCVYGLAGGLFGKIATQLWEKFITKKSKD